MAGLLDMDAMRQQALYSGLLGLGAQMMAAGAPSTRPGGMMPAVGQGLLGFQQGQQGYMGNAMRQGLLGMQMDQMQQAQKEKEQRDAAFKALFAPPASPSGSQVLSAAGGGPTMANAGLMAQAQPPMSPMLAGLTPDQIKLAQAAGPEKGMPMLMDFRKEAMQAPSVQSQFDQQGNEIKVQWDPMTRSWKQMGGAKPNLPTGMRIGASGQPEYIPEYLSGQEQISAARRPMTNVNLPPQQKKEDEAYGEHLVKEFTAINNKAAAAQSSLNQLGVARSIARNSDLPGDMQLAIGNTAVALGIPLPDAIKSRVTNGQAFVATMNNLVLSKLQEQTGPQTEGDAKRIESTTARLGNTPEARDFLLRAATTLSKRDIEQARFYESWKKEKGTFDGASSAWRQHVSQRPLVGTNPNSGLPVFYDEFVEGMKKANPGASEQQILQMWTQKYGQ